CASGVLLRTMSVSTVPGASALTRIPSGANEPAIDRVNDINAAFAPAYMATFDEKRNAPAEITLITDACGLAVRCGSASCTRNTGPRRFTSYDFDQASAVSEPSGNVNAFAALLTTMST